MVGVQPQNRPVSTEVNPGVATEPVVDLDQSFSLNSGSVIREQQEVGAGKVERGLERRPW